MKILVLGGNRFMGLRLVEALDKTKAHEIHIFNRTGQVPGQVPGQTDLVLHKGDRRNLLHSYLQESWDVIYDFCCYNDKEAEHAIEYFGKNVGRYIFVSTISVYDKGSPNILESALDPLKVDLKIPGADTYAIGKQRAEAAFFQKASFPVLAVRLPIVTGSDDYTRRLNFHVERVLNGRPIYLPNRLAKLSLIQSEDAANFLLWSLEQKVTGPLNVASREPVSVETLMKWVEESCKRKALYAEKPDENNASQYGIPADWFMDVSRCEALGFQCKPIVDWLPGLIESMVSENEIRTLH
jgi:nucleoside-diphosphate-sugar epimerase